MSIFKIVEEIYNCQLTTQLILTIADNGIRSMMPMTMNIRIEFIITNCWSHFFVLLSNDFVFALENFVGVLLLSVCSIHERAFTDYLRNRQMNEF